MPKFTDSVQSISNDIADGLLGKTQDQVDSAVAQEEKVENEVNLLNVFSRIAKTNITSEDTQQSGMIKGDMER